MPNYNKEVHINNEYLKDKLNSFLTMIPKWKRIVFMKRYFFSCTINEITKQMGKKEKNIISCLCELREMLRIHLDEAIFPIDKMDLFYAINSVDDKYILDAAKEYNETTVKNNIYKIGLVMTILIISIVIISKVISTIPTYAPELYTISKKATRWIDKEINEQYPDVDINGVNYSSALCDYDDDIGQFIGDFVFEFDEKTNIKNPEYTEEDFERLKTGELTEDSMFRKYIVDPNVYIPGIVNHKTIANVYEIYGINKDFAIAVQFEDSKDYYIYYSDSYRVENYKQFYEDLYLDEYLSFSNVCLFEGDNESTSKCSISVEELNELLFYNEDIPVFMKKDIPDEFRYGKKYYSSKSTVVPERITEFIKDKKFGRKKLSFSAEYSLLNEEDIYIAIYSGGFVETNIGHAGRVIYAGKDVVDKFILEIIDEYF